jgi:plastocyanin
MYQGGFIMRKFYSLLLFGAIFGFAFSSAINNAMAQGYTVMAVSNGGALTGTVTYAGAPPAPKTLQVTKDVAVCGKEGHVDESLVVASNKGIKDVLVSIKNINKGKSLDALGSNFVLDQIICVYRPHVSIVPVGKPLKILNSDGILHNIHTYGKKNPPKNIAQPKFKKEITETFAQPEIVPVKCDVHGWMSAYIVAVDHPYHAVTDANGKFTIADVPPGTYTIEFWQEKLGTQTKQVTVTAGGSATLDFTYPAAK